MKIGWTLLWTVAQFYHVRSNYLTLVIYPQSMIRNQSNIRPTISRSWTTKGKQFCTVNGCILEYCVSHKKPKRQANMYRWVFEQISIFTWLLMINTGKKLKTDIWDKKITTWSCWLHTWLQNRLSLSQYSDICSNKQDHMDEVIIMIISLTPAVWANINDMQWEERLDSCFQKTLLVHWSSLIQQILQTWSDKCKHAQECLMFKYESSAQNQTWEIYSFKGMCDFWKNPMHQSSTEMIWNIS